jgi:hypothetical protein
MKQSSRIGIIALMFIMILTVLPIAAGAASDKASIQIAAERMSSKGLVQGDLNGDLMVEKSISRAEMVTILVRAFGLEDEAKKLKGTPTGFNDVDSHPWASGYILAAKNLMEAKGEIVGKSATIFAPNANVSQAETIAFLMKFLGVKADSVGTWPSNYIRGAVNAELISSADGENILVNPNLPATRGVVFYYADYSFNNYTNENGATIYDSIVVQPSKPSTPVEPEKPVVTPTPSAAATIASPSIQDIHITYHPENGEINVNVLNPPDGVTKVIVYDQISGGNILAQTDKLISLDTSNGKIELFSTLIGTSFPEGVTEVYVILYDDKGNSSRVVGKKINP